MLIVGGDKFSSVQQIFQFGGTLIRTHLFLYCYLSENNFMNCFNILSIQHCMIILFSYRYLVCYSPFDIVYKTVKFMPCKLLVAGLKEVQRAHKVYHGVVYTAKIYPNSVIIILLIGTIKGKSLHSYIRQLVTFYWSPLLLQEGQGSEFEFWFSCKLSYKLNQISCTIWIWSILFSGAGSGLMKTFERLVRGLWIPGTNEVLQPSL